MVVVVVVVVVAVVVVVVVVVSLAVSPPGYSLQGGVQREEVAVVGGSIVSSNTAYDIM